MPPRYSYWTIIAGGLPTAFRAAEREELLPTFTRLKQKQPDAEMKWFARGKLWESPEDARQQLDRRRVTANRSTRDRNDPGDRAHGGDRGERGGSGERDRPGSDTRPSESRSDRPSERRGKDWRPGGEH